MPWSWSEKSLISLKLSLTRLLLSFVFIALITFSQKRKREVLWSFVKDVGKFNVKTFVTRLKHFYLKTHASFTLRLKL